MVVGETSSEPARDRKIHIEDSPTSLAIEMMMGQNIPVVAGCTNCGRNLINLAARNEYLEVSVDGPERERRHFGQQRFVDIGRRRMRIGLLKPASDSISLTRAVATWRRRISRGGRISWGDRIHGRTIVGWNALRQVKSENTSEF
jgi:hypothetical protein